MTWRLVRLDTAPLRFLVAGGSLSLLNLALRAGFDVGMPFRSAVGLAGVVTVTLSFFVYRRVVFRDTSTLTARAVLTFIAVNLVGLVTTVVVAAAALYGLGEIFDSQLAATLSHALGIGAGAAATYPLYRALTFATR